MLNGFVSRNEPDSPVMPHEAIRDEVNMISLEASVTSDWDEVDVRCMRRIVGDGSIRSELVDGVAFRLDVIDGMWGRGAELILKLGDYYTGIYLFDI